MRHQAGSVFPVSRAIKTRNADHRAV